MPIKNTESGGEGVRLLKLWKQRNGKTAGAMARTIGYDSTDSYFRICRYEYSPSPLIAGRIAKVIGKPRAWVLDHWATEVERRKEQMRRSA